MKQLIRIFPFFLSMSICINCTCCEKTGFMTRDQNNKIIAQDIIECLNTRNQKKLYDLFSQNVQAGNLSLKEKITKLFGHVEMKIDRYEQDAMSVDTSIRNNENCTEYHTKYKLWINGVEYSLRYIYIEKDDFDAKNEGVRSIRLVTKEYSDKHLCYWQDMKPGIFIYE